MIGSSCGVGAPSPWPVASDDAGGFLSRLRRGLHDTPPARTRSTRSAPRAVDARRPAWAVPVGMKLIVTPFAVKATAPAAPPSQCQDESLAGASVGSDDQTDSRDTTVTRKTGRGKVA